ncbi:MAG TPA: aminoglycoside 3'-phosphotransferase [Acidimicrobiia bacterium]|jgi:kanamycin kinase
MEPRLSVPDVVIRLAAGARLRMVWDNEVGGRTYEIGAGDARRFVKWSPHASGIDLMKEVPRLEWAGAFTPVPRVLDVGADEVAAWIVTAGLRGESAVSDRWTSDPETAVTQIGIGLRALHDALPVDACPFSWSVDDRVAAATELDVPSDPPSIDRLVVCHGDACSPNTLIDDDGRWSGHVDLGDLGVADRWADVAVATMATGWNYGPGWEDTLLDAYGVAPDPERTRFYRRLWNALTGP